MSTNIHVLLQEPIVLQCAALHDVYSARGICVTLDNHKLLADYRYIYQI